MAWLSLLLVIACMVALPWTWLSGRHRHPGWWGLPPALITAFALTLIDGHSQKLAGQLLMPLGLVWLALGLFTAAAGLGRRRGWCAALLAVFVLLTVSGSNWVGSWMMRDVEAALSLSDPIVGEPLEAVLVMGGGSYRRRDGFPQLAPSGDRLMVAAHLYHAKRTPLLVASGDLAEDARMLWERIGVPRSAVICLGEQINSTEEVLAYRHLIEERGWKRIGLVTSAWHLPRALRLCARQGFMPEPIPCDWLGDVPEFHPRELLPSADGMVKTTRAMWERLGAVAGR